MSKVVSLALYAGGSHLAIFGIRAYASARCKITRQFHGSPTYKGKLIYQHMMVQSTIEKYILID